MCKLITQRLIIFKPKALRIDKYFFSKSNKVYEILTLVSNPKRLTINKLPRIYTLS